MEPAAPASPPRPPAATAPPAPPPHPAGGARRFPPGRPALSGADLYEWIALRRVNDGGVAKVDDRWFDRGLRVPSYVADALTVLCGIGLVRLASPDGSDMRRAALTGAGAGHYRRLCEKRETIRPLPAAEPAPTSSWLTDHPHAHSLVRSVWNTLTELEEAGHHPGAIAALRRILTHHRPTRAGRCRTCSRHHWRRRRFPCIVWHQINTALR